MSNARRFRRSSGWISGGVSIRRREPTPIQAAVFFLRPLRCGCEGERKLVASSTPASSLPSVFFSARSKAIVITHNGGHGSGLSWTRCSSIDRLRLWPRHGHQRPAFTAGLAGRLALTDRALDAPFTTTSRGLTWHQRQAGQCALRSCVSSTGAAHTTQPLAQRAEPVLFAGHQRARRRARKPEP